MDITWQVHMVYSVVQYKYQHHRSFYRRMRHASCDENTVYGYICISIYIICHMPHRQATATDFKQFLISSLIYLVHTAQNGRNSQQQ